MKKINYNLEINLKLRNATYSESLSQKGKRKVCLDYSGNLSLSSHPIIFFSFLNENPPVKRLHDHFVGSKRFDIKNENMLDKTKLYKI